MTKTFYVSEQKKPTFISSNQAVQYFIVEMNSFAKYLQMKKTFFVNCHGLSDYRNKSTSNDLAKLSYYCTKQNAKFAEIVITKCYEAKIYNKNSKMMRV